MIQGPWGFSRRFLTARAFLAPGALFFRSRKGSEGNNNKKKGSMRQQQQPEPILIQIEVLAAAFPWDTVQLTAERKPEGEISYRVWIDSNDKLGFTSYVHAWAPTAEEAVAKAIAEYAERRNPETSREKAIAELREKIRKLEAIQIGLPPYIPNRELAQFVSKPTTIEV